MVRTDPAIFAKTQIVEIVALYFTSSALDVTFVFWWHQMIVRFCFIMVIATFPEGLFLQIFRDVFAYIFAKWSSNRGWQFGLIYLINNGWASAVGLRRFLGGENNRHVGTSLVLQQFLFLTRANLLLINWCFIGTLSTQKLDCGARAPQPWHVLVIF